LEVVAQGHAEVSAMLTGVTITGADDAVDPGELEKLSQEFPFVEWGVLFSFKRTSTPRYPGRAWVEEVTDRARFGRNLRLSAHVCGERARMLLLGDGAGMPVHGFRRVQINGYPGEGAGERFLEMAGRASVEFILQVRAEADLVRVAEDARRLGDSRASLLFDPSGGRGVEAFRWPRGPAGVRLGYAGGIKPSTVEDVLAAIGPVDATFWIDMESGVRVGDRLDLGLCREVLERAQPFILRAAA
jgi:hypothetical protein